MDNDFYYEEPFLNLTQYGISDYKESKSFDLVKTNPISIVLDENNPEHAKIMGVFNEINKIFDNKF